MKKTIKTIKSYIINNIKLFRFTKIGRSVQIEKGLVINGSFKEKITIGDNCFIGRNSRLGNTFNYKNGIVLGNNVYCGANFTAIGGEILIGNDCSISSNVTLIAGNHSLDPTTDSFGKGKIDSSTIIIKEKSWIGNNVVIVTGSKGGIVIGERCIVGAGSVVTKSIPDYSIAVGNPARVIKRWNFEKKKWECV